MSGFGSVNYGWVGYGNTPTASSSSNTVSTSTNFAKHTTKPTVVTQQNTLKIKNIANNIIVLRAIRLLPGQSIPTILTLYQGSVTDVSTRQFDEGQLTELRKQGKITY